VVTTSGNRDTHIILRGGRSGPNYHAPDVAAALGALARAGLPARLMIDASHGNSEKDHRRQAVVADALASQLEAGEPGLIGIMLESFIQAGRQDVDDPARLVYGQSITDACMDFDTTVAVLRRLATAVRRRRSR
jgi:3-deoxy-7-phosphoheptulonate synthase